MNLDNIFLWNWLASIHLWMYLKSKTLVVFWTREHLEFWLRILLYLHWSNQWSEGEEDNENYLVFNEIYTLMIDDIHLGNLVFKVCMWAVVRHQCAANLSFIRFNLSQNSPPQLYVTTSINKLANWKFLQNTDNFYPTMFSTELYMPIFYGNFDWDTKII